MEMSIVDIDGDGDLDALIGNSDGNTLVQLNTGSATSPAFAAATLNPYGLADVGFSVSPTFVDIDGDGDLDALIGERYGTTVVQLNTANPVAPVTSAAANGSYGVGSVITLTVAFNETVIVTGTPTLLLETGAIDRNATYSGGSGTSTLSFQYTVQAGDTSADLDQVSASALALNGGTIADAAGNNAVLTLAAPSAAGSLGANKAIVIDGVAPMVAITSSVPAVKIGQTATISFTFSEDPGASFTAADITTTGGTLGAITGAGLTRSATFTPAANTAANASITIAAASYTDAAGNAGSAGVTPALAVETTRPIFASASAISNQLVLTYTDASNLDAANPPPATAFAVLTASAPNAVTAVAVNAAAKTVTLTLTRLISFGETITVAYTDPTGGDDANAIQDAAGNDAASLAVTPAINNTAAPPAPPAPPTPPQANPDGDGDGVPDAQENQARPPNASGLLGDGNGDGSLDSAQANVSSAQLPGSTRFITVIADSNKGITDTDPGQAVITYFKFEAPPSNLPNGTNQFNPISFNAGIGGTGQTETFSIFVDASANPNGYWIQTANGAWNNIATSIQTVGDKVRIDFAIADGGQFDADGIANGSIAVTGGAGNMPLTLVGQPADLPPGGSFWF